MKPLRRRTYGRMPWDRDPNDREANYRAPIPFAERIRLFVKGVTAVAAFFWIRDQIQDGTKVGAKLLVGIGAAVAVAGLVDLLWTLAGRIQHVFLERRNQQIVGHSAMFLAGAAMIVAGALRLT